MAMIDVCHRVRAKSAAGSRKRAEGAICQPVRRTVCHTGTLASRIYRNGRWKSAWRWRRKRWDFMFPAIRWIDSPAEVARFSKKSIAELIGESNNRGLQSGRHHHGFPHASNQKRRPDGYFYRWRTLRARLRPLSFPTPTLNSNLLWQLILQFWYREDLNPRMKRAAKLSPPNLQPLSGIAERSAKTLRIRACLSSLSPESALSLHRLLESNRGDTGVDLELYDPSVFRVNIQSSDFVKVKSSTDLIRQIESICGAGCVQVVN